MVNVLPLCYSLAIRILRLNTRRPGITALVTVMVLGGVALFTAIVIALRGAGETDLTLTTLNGAQADALLAGCADEALLRLSRDAEFGIGNAVSFALGNGECTVTVQKSATNPTYDVIVTSRRQRSRKAARIKVLLPAMQIVSWDSIPPPQPE